MLGSTGWTLCRSFLWSIILIILLFIFLFIFFFSIFFFPEFYQVVSPCSAILGLLYENKLFPLILVWI